VVGGTNAAVRDIIAPLAEKLYVVRNSTVGGFGVRIIGSSGTGVTVPSGATVWVYCDGTNFNSINTESVGNFEVNGNLNVTGTTSLIGATAITGALSGSTAVFSGAISSVSPTFTGTPLATTASVSTDNTQIATTAFVRDIIPAGIISMWSGSIASIPSGWLLCDGTNSTPDLRNRFIVGAGSTYAVAATGGNADAVVVSHTHTANVNDSGHFHLSGMVTSASDNAFGTEGTIDSIFGSSRGLAPACRTETKATGITVTNTSTGVSGTNANLPPYYALAYIMKT
jgi:hypothetical protein